MVAIDRYGSLQSRDIAMIMLAVGFLMIVAWSFLLAEKGIDTPEFIKAIAYGIAGALCSQIPNLLQSQGEVLLAR
jgi:hypothetical protein